MKRWPTIAGCLSAFATLATFMVAMVQPAELADGMAVRAMEEPQGILHRVEEYLAARMPRLSEYRRTRLADALVDEALAARLDPLLVLAVIQVESSYDLNATSNVGAKGLMQLRPSTFRWEAALSKLGEVDVNDPVANVVAGVRYYGRLHRSFKRPETALMAYNAGPNRIRGFLREGGIPERYQEYPRRVLSEYRRLRRAYGLDPAPAVAESQIVQQAE